MAHYSVDTLLKAYRARNRRLLENRRLLFPTITGEDVYNPAYPLPLGGKMVLPARVERRDSEDARILLFEQDSQPHSWKPIAKSAVHNLQDPFWINVGTMLLLGGVSVDTSESGAICGWKTVFLRYNDLDDFSPFFTGPAGMKDVRLRSLPGGKIALFTRPQGTRQAGLGQIGFVLLNSIDELSIEAIEHAPLLNLFADDEWGGVNHIELNPDGSLCVLGHIARYSSGGHRHYYPMAFVLDPFSGTLLHEPAIIMERRDLLPGAAKRADLTDVIFPGGYVQGNGHAILYLGVGDAEIQMAVVDSLLP